LAGERASSAMNAEKQGVSAEIGQWRAKKRLLPVYFRVRRWSPRSPKRRGVGRIVSTEAAGGAQDEAMRWILVFALMLPMTVFGELPTPQQAKEWNATAETLMAQGSWDEARRTYLRLHALLEKSVGPEHPQTVMALANACDASVQLHRASMPCRFCRRALDLREKVLGPDAPETARTLSDLALLYSAREI